MTVRKLPKLGTPAADAIIEAYPTASAEHLAALVAQYEFSSVSAFMTSVFNHYHVRRAVGSTATPEIAEPIQYPAPELYIAPIKQEVRKNQGEEVQTQPIGDAHVGLVTPTYNSIVFGTRLNTLQTAMIKICLLHRKMRPIKKLVVPFLGDMAHGEQYGVQGFVEEYEMGAVEQIYDILVPKFTNFFVNLLQVYEVIEIYGVEGNHGNIQRKSNIMTKRSNWDIVFYRALKQVLSKYSRIKVKTQDVGGEWYQVIDVNGWKFLILHGDQILSYQGTPFYGMEKRGLRWKQSIGEEEAFDYILSGHIHNPNKLYNAGVPWYTNGCFSTDSKFPLTRMGLKDIPVQWAFFVNKKFGITARYEIDLRKGDV